MQQLCVLATSQKCTFERQLLLLLFLHWWIGNCIVLYAGGRCLSHIRSGLIMWWCSWDMM